MTGLIARGIVWHWLRPAGAGPAYARETLTALSLLTLPPWFAGLQ